jgi:hypothetical protein
VCHVHGVNLHSLSVIKTTLSNNKLITYGKQVPRLDYWLASQKKQLFYRKNSRKADFIKEGIKGGLSNFDKKLCLHKHNYTAVGLVSIEICMGVVGCTIWLQVR